MPMIIDVDSHVTEPEDVWTARVSRKWADSVPRVRWDSSAGEECWFMGDINLGPAWASACADHPFPAYPKTKSEALPAAWDSGARLAMMDAVGIAVQALYPNVGGFCGERFLRFAGPELAMELARAYNDFVIDWIQPEPSRFLPLAILPLWDVRLAVAEVERVAALGHKGLLMSGAPHELGLAFLAERYWDPLWAVSEETGLAISVHKASGDVSRSLNERRLEVEGESVMYARSSTEILLGVGQQLNDLLLSGVLPRFPDLRFVFAESAVGWVPFLLESVDHHFIRGNVHADRPWFEELPSVYFHRQCHVTYWFERLSTEVLEKVGADNILFETDFPHPTCLWGDQVQRQIDVGLGNQPEAVRDSITHRNAARLFKVDLPLSRL